MTNHQFYAAYVDAHAYTDRDAYISDLALSSMWGDGPEDDVPGERLAALQQIWDVAHLSFRELRRAVGLTQAAMAERFLIPKRTIENWEATGPSARTCPEYIKVMIAELLGLLDTARVD